MLKHNTLLQNTLKTSQQLLTDNSIENLTTKKINNLEKIPFLHKTLFQDNQNQLITVPIKEYSNKFLRQKRKEELQHPNKKKQPFLNSHLQNNRKLISDFKKIKGRSQKFKNTFNKENGDIIIRNLFYQKNQQPIPLTSNIIHKTIFGNFAQNCHTKSIQHVNQESCLFDQGWKTVKNQNPFLTKKQVYQKICQKQKSLIPEYRKKSKTFADVPHHQSHDFKDKKIERISTSRALQKYSKIIKVNPEHGKIEKMKIKKQLAKSLRFQNSEKSDFETKQIILSRKDHSNKNKNNFVLQEANRNYSIDFTNKESENDDNILRTPKKQRISCSKENSCNGKVSLFSAGSKIKRMRKFSHQVQPYKKCVTQQKFLDQNQKSFQDFQINGWDINF